jgi:hypothetical protein
MRNFANAISEYLKPPFTFKNIIFHWNVFVLFFFLVALIFHKKHLLYYTIKIPIMIRQTYNWNNRENIMQNFANAVSECSKPPFTFKNIIFQRKVFVLFFFLVALIFHKKHFLYYNSIIPFMIRQTCDWKHCKSIMRSFADAFSECLKPPFSYEKIIFHRKVFLLFFFLVVLIFTKISFAILKV